MPGECVKYNNNDGACEVAHTDEFIEVFEKAQKLSHFTYRATEKEMMLLDLQGSKYNLYDPEIATTEQCDTDGEVNFCSGNLSKYAIKKFFEQHTYNKYCEMVKLIEVEAANI